jgi:uncharacterized membrane protein YkoI
MQRRSKLAIGVAAVAVTGAVGAGAAVATSDDDATERSITGSALAKASDAALEHTGEGTVTETELGDEESYYEVEVTLEDGSQVDVQLDRDFKVVSSSGDDDTKEDGEDD